MDPNVIVPNKLLNNHAYNVVRKAYDYYFKFHLLTESEKWNIPLIESSVRNFVYQQVLDIQKKNKEIIIRKAAVLSIYDLCKVDAELLILESVPETERETFANMQAFKITKKIPSIDNRKREFVWTHQDHNLILGQINKKHTTRKYTIKHWVMINNTQKDNNEIMYKTIQCCNSCYLNDKRINKGNRNCYFNKDHLDLNCINRISSCKNTPNTKIIKDILEIRHHPKSQHSSEHTPNLIQIYDYDTALIQNTLSDKESTTQHIALLHYLRSIFNPSGIINIYTDGSLTSCFNTELNTLTKHMITGWVIFNNKDEVIVECSSSIKDWPSSTCAELEAILSVILVLQTGQIANIFTDSQAAIDIKVKSHSGVKGNEEADKVAKNGTEKLTCITINDSQQKDLKYDLYWNGKRVDRNIRKFIDRQLIFIIYNLLSTLKIMKEKRYDLYGDIKCRLCLKENEDDDHIIYCQQLKDKWLIVANNTMCKSDQMIKDLLLQELPIPFTHLLLRNFFPKEKYKELKDIVKSEKATLTIATIFLEIFINEFYDIIW
ncbi:ribonuclease H-like domain-containing protein [Rhizophagus clarus]|uniref:Ribonuclease H-like domain-containing protein n=1 Tax=Rhizophagus clarus TaxID=94130 RepID=A0A8H3KW22_9GLOM|nr:ribonuclease H-like domain-containing protein [Rhizophagus clarus]